MNEWICLLWTSAALQGGWCAQGVPITVPSLPPGPSCVPQPLQGRHPGCQIFLLSCHQNLRPPACVCLVPCESEAWQRQVSTSCSSTWLLLAPVILRIFCCVHPCSLFGFYPVHAGGHSSKSLNLALTAEIPATRSLNPSEGDKQSPLELNRNLVLSEMQLFVFPVSMGSFPLPFLFPSSASVLFSLPSGGCSSAQLDISGVFWDPPSS